MTDFAFDVLSYDMSLADGDIALTNSDNEIVQRLTAKLQLIKGEWFLNALAGLPFPDVIFEAATDLNDIYNLLRQEIKDTEGVETIDSLTITPNDDERSLLVEFSVNSGLVTDTITLP